jgi:DNA-binding Xre family transcriptional regulator
MTTDRRLRSNLAHILEQRRMSMRELARRVDYRFDTVRQLCNSESVRIPVELIERVCQELNIGITDLFTLEKKGE